MLARMYSVTLTGDTPLLLHHDNVVWAEQMKAWGLDPGNKKRSVAGDDRSPAFRWLGCLYSDGTYVTIPSDNLMTMLREGGAKCSTGQGKSTFKALTQTGLVVNESDWPILIDGHPVPMAPLRALADVADFSAHEAVAGQHGFSLFVKRARVGQAKHVRVRPRFDRWSISGTITVFEERITRSVLENILKLGGAYSGLGDWRPSSPSKPGPYGKFSLAMQEV